MTRRVRFRVIAKLDAAGGAREGTVTIDWRSGVVTVRPLRRRRTYTLSLADVATWICQTHLRLMVAEQRRAKKLARKRT
jgi:hypothetical protein